MDKDESGVTMTPALMQKASESCKPGGGELPAIQVPLDKYLDYYADLLHSLIKRVDKAEAKCKGLQIGIHKLREEIKKLKCGQHVDNLLTSKEVKDEKKV